MSNLSWGKKAALAASAAMLGLLAATATAGTPALAATSGCGSVCDGKDPATYIATVDGTRMRCSYIDVQTIDGHSVYATELRYSPFCRTAWARDLDPGYLAYVTIESYGSDGKLRKVYKASGAWTPMVNDKGMKARACRYQWDSEADTDRPARKLGCTVKF